VSKEKKRTYKEGTGSTDKNSRSWGRKAGEKKKKGNIQTATRAIGVSGKRWATIDCPGSKKAPSYGIQHPKRRPANNKKVLSLRKKRKTPIWKLLSQKRGGRTRGSHLERPPAWPKKGRLLDAAALGSEKKNGGPPPPHKYSVNFTNTSTVPQGGKSELKIRGDPWTLKKTRNPRKKGPKKEETKKHTPPKGKTPSHRQGALGQKGGVEDLA